MSAGKYKIKSFLTNTVSLFQPWTKEVDDTKHKSDSKRYST